MATITYFGRSREVTPKQAKLFLFTVMPAMLFVAGAVVWIVLSVVGEAIGLHWLVLGVACLVLMTEVTLNTPDNKTVAVLPRWARSLLGWGLLAAAVVLTASQQRWLENGLLLIFVAYQGVSKALQRLTAIKSEELREAQRLAKRLRDREYGADVSDASFRDVSP